MGEKMAWVSVHDNVIGKKLRELAKELDSTQEEALGVLVSLWLWGLNNADKEGRIVNADKDDILEAFTLKLVGKLDGSSIVDALIRTRWLDEPAPGSLYIHDWEQWQEQWYKAMERREKDAIRKAESRRRTGGSTEAPESGDPGELPFPEVEQEKPAQAPKRQEYPKEFEEFWAAYPRKDDKGQAYKKYHARRKDGFSAEELLTAAKNYAAQCKRKKTEREFTKQAKTFLSETTPFIDYLPKREAPADETPKEDGGNPFGKYREDS